MWSTRRLRTRPRPQPRPETECLHPPGCLRTRRARASLNAMTAAELPDPWSGALGWMVWELRGFSPQSVHRYEDALDLRFVLKTGDDTRFGVWLPLPNST